MEGFVDYIFGVSKCRFINGRVFLSLSNCTNITGIYYALYKNTLKLLSGTQTFMTMLTKLEMNHDI